MQCSIPMPHCTALSACVGAYSMSLLRTACMLSMSFTILCILKLCTPLVRVCRQGNEDIACQVSISPIAEAAAQWRNDAQVTTHGQFWLCACLSTRH